MASNNPQCPHKNGDIAPNVPRQASSDHHHDHNHHAHSSAHSPAGHDTASLFDDRDSCGTKPAEAGASGSISLVRRTSKPVPQTTDPPHVKGQITTAAKTALPSLSLPSQPSSSASSSMQSVPVDQSHASLTMACAATALPPTFRLQPGDEPSLLPEPTRILPSLETTGRYGRKSSVPMNLVDEEKHEDVDEDKEEVTDEEDDTLHGSAATFRKRTQQSIAPFLTKHIAAQYASRGRDQSQNDRSNTKYCYRHRPDLKCRRAANEPSMEQLQNELTALPQSDQQGISQVWSLFSAAPAKHRTLILQGLLAQCCFPQLSFVSASVRELLKIDFISALPSELSLKIMCYLDPTSLCKAAQVSQKWTEMANDDVVWHRMCEQHIDRKCSKCGWGLPLLDKYRLRMERRQMQARAKGRQLANHERVSLSPAPQSVDVDSHGSLETLEKGEGKRRFVEHALAAQSPGKRQCPPSDRQSDQSYFQARRKPWKDVYRDRFRIGTNWKYGRYTLKTFNGHTNGVICLQYDNEVLATGSYDCTIKVWDMETGTELRTLTGHTLGVRCLQFDDSKLVSGGLDGKIKIWNMRTGDLMRTLEGGEGGVIGLHLAGSILACGSADKTIKVWNFKTREDFVLHGHEEWVNSVKVDTASRTLFSGGDDCKVYLWDLDERRIIKSFEGHVAQVQQVLPLASDFDYFDADDASDGSGPAGQQSERKSSAETRWTDYSDDPKNADRKPPPRYLLTAGLDSMIRLWDVWTGRSVRMFWGHLEGIWALAADSLRLVSASNDGMVKVWDPRTGNCETTLTGHQGPVTCVDLSDRRMCTGSEDHTVRLYTFDP